MTDSDFRSAPAAANAPSGGGTLMKQYAPPGEVSDSEPPSGKRPGFLTFLGVINSIWAVIFLLGTLALLGLGLAIGINFLG